MGSSLPAARISLKGVGWGWRENVGKKSVVMNRNLNPLAGGLSPVREVRLERMTTQGSINGDLYFFVGKK